MFSSKQGCWISKAKFLNAGYLIGKLKELGFSDKGTIGEKLTFEEQIMRDKEKAQKRSVQAVASAQNATKRSNDLYNQAKDMASYIPMGQPIHVGHHSEKRDRNYRN